MEDHKAKNETMLVVSDPMVSKPQERPGGKFACCGVVYKATGTDCRTCGKPRSSEDVSEKSTLPKNLPSVFPQLPISTMSLDVSAQESLLALFPSRHHCTGENNFEDYWQRRYTRGVRNLVESISFQPIASEEQDYLTSNGTGRHEGALMLRANFEGAGVRMSKLIVLVSLTGARGVPSSRQSIKIGASLHILERVDNGDTSLWEPHPVFVADDILNAKEGHPVFVSQSLLVHSHAEKLDRGLREFGCISCLEMVSKSSLLQRWRVCGLRHFYK